MGKLAKIFLFIFVLMLSSCSDSINSSDNANISDNQNNSDNSSNSNGSNNSEDSNNSSDNQNNSENSNGGNTPPHYSSEPFLDFSCIDNEDNTLTCTAYLSGATATEYVWNTLDEFGKKGEKVTLSLWAGRQRITLLADDGSGEYPYMITKEFNVGATYTDKVFLFSKQESEPQYMYFAVKVKGNSSKGLFRQRISDNEYAYVRDLHMESPEAVATSGSNPTKYSNFNGADTMTICANYNVCVKGYNVKTGFASEDGNTFEFPFYYGDDNFRVKMNGNNDLTFAFDAFITRDTTKSGNFGGLDNPSFASVHGGKKLTINIPMSQFDSTEHKNIALFTINFKDYNTGTEFPEVIFEGFERK